MVSHHRSSRSADWRQRTRLALAAPTAFYRAATRRRRARRRHTGQSVSALTVPLAATTRDSIGPLQGAGPSRTSRSAGHSGLEDPLLPRRCPSCSRSGAGHHRQPHRESTQVLTRSRSVLQMRRSAFIIATVTAMRDRSGPTLPVRLQADCPTPRRQDPRLWI